MSQILCSTGALIGRPNNRDYRILEQLRQKLSCDGFEFMMYSTWYGQTDEIADFIKKLELYVPVMHCDKRIGESISRNEEGDLENAIQRFRVNCETARRIGAEKLVLHLWGGQPSDRCITNNLDAYERLEALAKEHGLLLTVENVVCNRENPMKHLCELRERYPKVQFTFDTKMSQFHAETELLYTEEYRWLWEEKHISHYHVNDYGGGYMDWENLKVVPIGEGNVDFERFFSYINRIGYEGTFTVEATAFDDTGRVDTDMLNRCFDYIRRHISRDC